MMALKSIETLPGTMIFIMGRWSIICKDRIIPIMYSIPLDITKFSKNTISKIIFIESFTDSDPASKL